MAECDSGQLSFTPCQGAQGDDDAFPVITSPEASQPVEHASEDTAALDDVIKHKKHQNGLVTHLLKTTDDVDNGESADSGHGSSCQDCECVSTLSQLAMESEMTQLSLSDDLSADTNSVCQYVPGASALCGQGPGQEDAYGIQYVVYESEEQMPDIIRLITKDLSEPYSIYTYRYFIHNWPKLCFLVSITCHVCRYWPRELSSLRSTHCALLVDCEQSVRVQHTESQRNAQTLDLTISSVIYELNVKGI